MMGIGIWQLLIILVIVLLLFGTKKLRNIGGDVGGAIKNFKHSMSGGESDEDPEKDDSKRLDDDSMKSQEATQSDKEKNHV